MNVISECESMIDTFELQLLWSKSIQVLLKNLNQTN